MLFLAYLLTQRVAELFIARRNTARLMARGAREIGANHYPVMVALHASWLTALVVLGWNAEINYIWLAIYAVLQIARFWILGSLGARWTTRIIVIDEPLVTKGPFGRFPHPNYLLVVAEVFVAPLVLNLLWVAAIWSALNAAMLVWRVSTEERALASRR